MSSIINYSSKPNSAYFSAIQLARATVAKVDTQECVYGMAQHVQSIRDVEAQLPNYLVQIQISDHRLSGWHRFVEWLKALDQRNQVSAEQLICLMFQTMNWNKPNASGEENGVVAECRPTTIFKLLCTLVGSEMTLKIIAKGFVNPNFWVESVKGGIVLMGSIELRVEVEIPSVKNVNVNKALYLASMKYNRTNTINNKQDTVELDGIYTLFRQQQSMIQHCRAFLGKIQLGVEIQANGENKKVTFDEAVVETIVRHFSISREDWDDINRDEEGNAKQFREVCDGDRTVLFRNMCKGIGRTDIVLQMLEATIQRSSSSRSFTIDALMHAVNTINDPHYDTMVHLDCFYFLLRREPTVLRHVRSSSTSSSSR